MTLNIVLDTNVLISATVWENSISNKLLFYLLEQDANIYSSLEILREYVSVLKRDFLYSDQKIKEILSKLVFIIKLVKPLVKINLILNDPEDNKIIECALESKAHFILTYDKHLLKIKEFDLILIKTPDAFLKTFRDF